MKLGKQVGRLGDVDLLRLNRAVMVFLGLAGSALEEAFRNGASRCASLPRAKRSR